MAKILTVYVQKSLNLQVWNEELTGSRRYALIRLSDDNSVTDVRVVRGHLLATFDRTGTLTSKFQAKRHDAMASNVLVSASDTATVQALRATEKWCHLFDVTEIFGNLSRLVGKRFANPGKDQERGRGALLHQLVELALGEEEHTDTGRFPDVPNQLLELKLQTSPTIDLGLISPDSRDAIQEGCDVSHCDIRYAIFYAHLDGDDVVLDSVVVATGEDFFNFFRRFEGRVINRKRQIPLPKDLFR